MTRMHNLILFLSMLSVVTALQQKIIIDRIKHCLEEGRLVDFTEQKDQQCHSIFSKGPCKDGEWWLQKSPGVSCSENECKVPVQFITGLGECKPKQCNLNNSEVFFNGKCVNLDVNNCSGQKGKTLVVDLRGDAKCRCGDGWAEDSNGNCQFLYSQGSCGDGYLFLRREQALTRKDLDVPCRDNIKCDTSCESLEYFSETLQEDYGCHDDRCQIDGKPGFCCPENIPDSESAILWYLDRMKLAENTRGICVRNPCPPGEILHHNISRYNNDYTKVLCYKADESMKTCQTEVDYNEATGKLTCCEPFCLATFAARNVARANCRRGYFFSRRRKRCIRGYGKR